VRAQLRLNTFVKNENPNGVLRTLREKRDDCSSSRNIYIFLYAVGRSIIIVHYSGAFVVYNLSRSK